MIKMDWNNQTISIAAQKQPLSSVLQRLERQEGITVSVVDFEEKEVTLNLENQPLDAALSQLLGPDKRYLLDVGERELAVKGLTTSKEGKKGTPAAGLQPKYAVSDTSLVRAKLQPERNAKMKVEDIRLTESDGERGTKKPAGQLAIRPDLEVVKTEKQRIAPVQEEKKYTRLRFRMDGDVIKVEKAMVLPGELTVPPMELADYVYTVEMNGKIIELGSFQDPLEMHSHYPEPDKEHELLVAPTGYFVISLPGQLVSPDRLKSLTLEFFRVEGSVAIPTLNISQFERLRNNLRSVSRNILEREDFPIEDLTRE
ncbi:MAG: hypothetical protein DA408_19035 [Bacteroidetes bacterium]|nr:MAG: hypothetical protein C7N36_04290 [Bacteroidota bacterium]PTM09158.1 MAG: hypothetical protein DA408_19035 [Bacteroidota bacterium]